MDDRQRGVYPKYNVTKISTGEPVHGVFVLRPDRDEHARKALQAYADSCQEEYPVLASDLNVWLSNHHPFGCDCVYCEDDD